MAVNIKYRAPNPVVHTDTTIKNSSLSNEEIDGNFKNVKDAIEVIQSADGAAAVGFTPTGTVAATNVQSAINEVVSDLAAGTGSSLVGYTPAGTGAVATTVQSKLREFLSVKDFGAVADATFTAGGSAGGTDNLLKFQAALSAAVVLGISRVRAPGGAYYLSGKLTIPRGITLEGDGTGHLPAFLSGSANRRGTCLLINGAAGNDCLTFEENAGHAGLRDISIYNANANAIRSVVSVVGHLYPRMNNVEIASLRKTTGNGMFMCPSQSGAQYETLWGAFHNVMVTITDVGGANEASVRYGLSIYGFSATKVCNANSFVSGQFVGTWGGLKVDGDAGDTGALSCVFHGTKFDVNWDGTFTPEYKAAASGVFGWLKNNCYIYPVVHIKKGRDLAFHGCYFEAAGAPATFDNGVNGSHTLIAVFYNGEDATYNVGTNVIGCNWNNCYLYDVAARALVTPIQGRRYDTRIATHLLTLNEGVQTVPPYAWTKVNLSPTPLFGDDSFIGFDAANEAVKIRSSGTYLINAQIEYAGWTNAGSWAALRIQTDAGYTFRGVYAGPIGTGEPISCEVSTTINLLRGQSVWIETFHNQGSSQNTSGAHTRLSVVKID